MTHWYNFGVDVESEDAAEEVIEIVESLGCTVYVSASDRVLATALQRDLDRNADVAESVSVLSGVNGVVVVSANDTSDTASATVYDCFNGEIEVDYRDRSGGESTRRHWGGVRKGSVHLDGGKYY